MAGPVVVSIIGDARNLMSSLGQSESRLGRFGRAAGTMGKAVGAGLATGVVAVGGLAIAAVKSASNAQQSLGATETVFGRYADTVVKNSDRAAKAVGLSSNEYRESANLIGSLFKNQGVSADQLAGKTDQMVKAGADLAATFGGPTKDAVAALGSAFKGEFDPLEKYGISIKQSTINAELAARGQDKLTGAALAQAKQQATTSLIMRQGKDSIGAFGRETDTLAHQQQVLGAQWDNLKSKGGSALLPVLTRLGQVVNDRLFPAMERMGPPIQRFAQQAGGVLGPILSRVGSAIAAAWPVVLRLGAAIASVVPPILAVAGQVGKNLKPVFDQLVTTFKTQVLPTIIRMTPTVQQIATKIGQFAGTALRLSSAIAGRVLPVVIRFAGFLFSRVVPAVVRVVAVVVRVIGALVSLGAGFARAVGRTTQFAATVIRAIASIPGKVTNAIGALVGKGRDLITGLIRGIGDKMGDARQKVREFLGKAKDALSGAGTALLGAGRNLINGLIQGIGEKIGAAIQKVKDGLQKIKNLLPGSPIKEGPLRSWNNGGAGKRLMDLLGRGLQQGAPRVQRIMEAISADLATTGSSSVPVLGVPQIGRSGTRRPVAVATTVPGGGSTKIEISLKDIPIAATGADIGRELAEFLADYFATGGPRP